MDDGKNIVRLNIEHYKRLLATETNPGKREAFNRQLAEQDANLLQKRERERRSG
jgi:hypothetical protein